jgi:NAD(P)-dependent dehydrogenase (short-subunit alcohol dehydrogenase family)
VAVTGGADGGGLATSRAFASLGASPAIADRDQAALDSAEDELGSMAPEVWCSLVDVGDETALERSFGGAKKRFGRIDVLVAVPGRSMSGPLVASTSADWTAQIDGNFRHILVSLGLVHLYRRRLRQDRWDLSAEVPQVVGDPEAGCREHPVRVRRSGRRPAGA